MKIYSLKRSAIPKIAVLVTGLTAAILAATVSPQAAQAYPRAASCTGCHAGATTTTVTATPSAATQLAGASYTVAITLTANPNGGNTGYGIVPVAPAVEKTFGGNTGSELAFTATMIAPAAAGTYSYTVWTNQGPTDGTGQVGSKVYSITVAPVVTIPPTTIPPTTSAAVITGLSPRHGAVGTVVTLTGTGFGELGSVQFGTVVTTATSWTDTQIVFEVPAGTTCRVAHVSVIPGSDTASNAVSFRFDKAMRSPHHAFQPGHSSWNGHSFGDDHAFKAIAAHMALFEGSDD